MELEETHQLDDIYQWLRHHLTELSYNLQF